MKKQIIITKINSIVWVLGKMLIEDKKLNVSLISVCVFSWSVFVSTISLTFSFSLFSFLLFLLISVWLSIMGVFLIIYSLIISGVSLKETVFLFSWFSMFI